MISVNAKHGLIVVNILTNGQNHLRVVVELATKAKEWVQVDINNRGMNPGVRWCNLAEIPTFPILMQGVMPIQLLRIGIVEAQH